MAYIVIKRRYTKVQESRLESLEKKLGFLGGIDNYQAVWRLPPELAGGGEGFIMTVKGDGMNGAGINNGDYLVCQVQTEAADGDLVLVVRTATNESMVRRYVKKEHRFVIRREDGITPDEDAEDFSIVGKVMTIIRKVAQGNDVSLLTQQNIDNTGLDTVNCKPTV
jgi:hypothetical protein